MTRRLIAFTVTNMHQPTLTLFSASQQLVWHKTLCLPPELELESVQPVLGVSFVGCVFASP